MRLFFVRHGESTANLEHIFSNTNSYHPLTVQGIAQAQALALAFTGIRIDRVYSSPILRAVQTAQLLVDMLSAPLEITEALREWSVGIFEGTDAPAGWELHHHVQEEWFTRERYDSRMPGGESLEDMRQRFVPFISNLVTAYHELDRNLVLVSHGGLYTAMLPVICSNLNWHFAREHGFGHTTIAIVEPRDNGLYCTSWGDFQL
jgi:broad specificity phosphatase PhoE